MSSRLQCLRRNCLRVREALPTVRRQQQHHGPHKEYFQEPYQFPTPPAPHVPPLVAPPVTSSQPGAMQSLLRSTLWAILFTSTGIASGISLVTWDYLLTPLEPGADAELELFQDIVEETDQHPLVTCLREHPEWQEQRPYDLGSRDQERLGDGLFNHAYLGARGIVLVCHMSFGRALEELWG